MNHQPVLAAQLMAQCLSAQGVQRVYGIPGAKIDALFEALDDVGIETIVCRHEQNAAFMAAMEGRLTNRPGVVIVTSGPGVANLPTGLATANSEGDPVVAIGGAVIRTDNLKHTHQNIDNVALLRPVTKYCVEATTPEAIPEIIANAFRASLAGRRGASFISVPADVLTIATDNKTPIPALETPLSPAPLQAVENAVEVIAKASNPMILLGLDASRENFTNAVRKLLDHHRFAVAGTFQAAGVVPERLLECFVGRVGLSRNQPGDVALDQADVILTVGFDPIEYDPRVWNSANNSKIIHIDVEPAQIDNCYHPVVELVGDIAGSLDALTAKLPGLDHLPRQEDISAMRGKMENQMLAAVNKQTDLVHPLVAVRTLRKLAADGDYIVSDVGSHYMWLGRHFWSFEPQHLVFSNGQQTLGVALPRAAVTSVLRPNARVISVSGDGGFLFSAMELETAVRMGAKFVHMVWRDGGYNMVKIQEDIKYGRDAAVKLGQIDLVKYAESFGVAGLRVDQAEDFEKVLVQALEIDGPVLIDVPIDYSDNPTLFADVMG